MENILQFPSREDRIMAQLPSRIDALAMTRAALLRFASWTRYLYDADAATRLTGVPEVPPFAPHLKVSDYHLPQSAGTHVEGSMVLMAMARVHELVSTGSWRGSLDDLCQTQRELTPFYRLLEHRGNAIVGEWDESEFLDEEIAGPLLRLLAAFHGRTKLELNEALDLPLLAAVAGLSEKTVRMAAIGRDANPDLATFKDGPSTRVNADEARRWLATKRYRPTRLLGAVTAPVIPAPQTTHELGEYLQQLRSRAGLEMDALIARLGWSAPMAQGYERLEAGELPGPAVLRAFTTAEIARLARIIDPDHRATVTRSVCEILLREQLQRDIEQQFPLDIDPSEIPEIRA